MTDDEWHARWREGRIGFHLPHVNPQLARWLPELAPTPSRVLVPLCGKTVDLAYLVEQGHEAVGVELVELAAREFFSERGDVPPPQTREGRPVYAAEGVEIHVADVLEVPASALGPIQHIYDRAALIALPPEVRGPYARRMLELLPSGGRMLLLTIAYDQSRIDGPPFSVPDEEVRALYGEAGELTRLHLEEAAGAPPRFAELGLVVEESTWLFVRR